MKETADDISAIRSLERSWCDLWNTHNMRSLANLLATDADFVTVGGDWLRGRKEFTKWHAALHSTAFKHSTFTVTGTTIKFIAPGVALVHLKWRVAGDFNPDGTPRKPRTGIFTQVLQKSRGRWLILASQNTNDVKPSGDAFLELLKRRVWD